jgi:hypothetical protein
MIEFVMLYLSNFLKHFYQMIVQMGVLTIHALFPLLFLLSSATLLGLYYLLKEKHVIIKFNWSDRTKKIIILFLVFIFPVLIYPISFLADERYIMQYSVFVMIACAITIYRVQEIINDSYRRHVFIFFNSTAIITIFVLILYVYKNGSSPYQLNYYVYLVVFISLLSSQLYRICKGEMKDQGILMVYLISFATITGLCRICNDIDCYRKLFPYNKTLPEIIKSQHANIGLRRAGFWIAHNVNDLSNIRIMAAGKGDVALFYAYGRKREPETQSKQIPLGAKLESISMIMKNEKIDYLLFDKNYINRYSALKTLWNNPKLANLYGLKTLYIDSEKYFQIYKSE